MTVGSTLHGSTSSYAEDALSPLAAREHVLATALRAGTVGAVGLELEGHLVDLACPGARVPWERIRQVVADLPGLPGGSIVTVEPGGQIELSSPPATGVVDAVVGLRRDVGVLRTALLAAGLGLAHIGADPARPPVRVNPGARYAAMERHFVGRGQRAAGAAMMCGTASLQVNLEAGPTAGWSARVALAHQLGPVLVAVSACSPMLAGRRTGWRSSRQRVWAELDAARTGPLLGGDEPAEEWAAYALTAPVLLVRGAGGGGADAGGVQAVEQAVPFGAWAAGDVPLGGRAPTVADLDYHLTTLFPPVRLRGFLEVRYLDAVPARWWPALAAIVATLLDDPVASEVARAATERVSSRWSFAARAGLADPALHAAAVACLDVAARRAPAVLAPDVEAYADLVAAGRSPGDAVQERARRGGALAALVEAAAW